MPVYENILTAKKKVGKLYPTPVPLKVEGQIHIYLIGPLKQTEGYRNIVMTVDYTGRFVRVEPLKEKNVRM